MKKSKTKALIFLRRNAVYLVLSLCILAVGLSIVFMLIQKDSALPVDSGKVDIIVPNEPDNPVDNPKTPMCSPY